MRSGILILDPRKNGIDRPAFEIKECKRHNKDPKCKQINTK